jgi:hypothetical protein
MLQNSHLKNQLPKRLHQITDTAERNVRIVNKKLSQTITELELGQFPIVRNTHHWQEPVQSWATDWTIGVLGFDSRQGLGIFLFITASRPALGPTQTPIQWAPGVLSLGVKRPGREANHSPPSSAEVKEWVGLYLHSPNTPTWCGGTTLPFTHHWYDALYGSYCLDYIRSTRMSL